MERRIDASLKGHDPDARIKQIAGLIRDLPYRNMRKLGEEIFAEFTKADSLKGNAADDMVEGLLAWAEKKVG